MPESKETSAAEAANVEELLDKALEAKDPPAEAAPPPTQPTWKDAVLDGEDVPENFRGKKAADLLNSWNHGQEAVRRMQSERDRFANEANQLRLQQQIQQAVKEAMPPKPQAETQLDPREAQIDELLLLGEFAQARKIQREIDNEGTEQRLAAEREKIKSEIGQQAQHQRDRDVTNWAYKTAMETLASQGVPAEMFTPRRITALYSALTLPPSQDAPNPYFDAGGPQNPSAVVALWKEMYGTPQAAAVAPAIAIPPPPPVVTAPPGGSRPAPVSGVAPADTNPMRGELRDLYASIAEERNWDKDKFIDRAKNHRRQRGVA